MMIRLANCRGPAPFCFSKQVQWKPESPRHPEGNTPSGTKQCEIRDRRSTQPLLQPEMKATVQHIRTSLFHMPANFPVVIPSAKMGRNDHLVFEFLSPLH